MKLHTLTAAVAATLLLAACNDPAPAATTAAPAANEAEATAGATPADAATQTEAVYGDEAPVAIEAEALTGHDDDHAHNADGSHPEGVEHADAKGADEHSHAEGEGDHTH